MSITALIAPFVPVELLIALQEVAPGATEGVDGTQETAPSGGIPFPMLLLLMAGIFYFVVFAPERKARKRKEQMRAELEKGDKVMTTSGLFGSVVQVQDDVVTLQVDEGVRLKFTRAAVQDRIDPPAKDGAKDGSKDGSKSSGDKKGSAKPAELAEKA